MSLPSSMADFVPCDRLLQKAYWPFHVVVLQRTAKKCTKSYNPRAEPLFCSLNLLLSDVPVAVAVVVILNSLIQSELQLSVI